MESVFNDFLDHFKEAIKLIDEDYINISVYELPDKIYRERVYCYELYHQLRNLLGDNEYILDGELDKKAHPIISSAIGGKIPDFVIHKRGNMDLNLVIVEVKSINNLEKKRSNLNTDLEKIKDFIEEADYQKGIMLIYSNGTDQLTEEIIKIYREKTRGFSNKLLLIWHPGPGFEPIVI